MVDTAAGTMVPKPASIFVASRFARELIAMVGLFALYKYGRSIMSVDVTDGVRQRQQHLGTRALVPPAERAERPARDPDRPLDRRVREQLLRAGALPRDDRLLRLVVPAPRPTLYPSMRRAMIAITSIALLCHLRVPAGPAADARQPRLHRHRRAIYGPNVYTKAPNATASSNQYAAMPSLHVGWAVLVAAGLIAATRSRWRWLWLLHPTITTIAVVATANHYWLDSIAACIVLAAVTLILGRFPWARVQRIMRMPVGQADRRRRLRRASRAWSSPFPPAVALWQAARTGVAGDAAEGGAGGQRGRGPAGGAGPPPAVRLTAWRDVRGSAPALDGRLPESLATGGEVQSRPRPARLRRRPRAPARRPTRCTGPTRGSSPGWRARHARRPGDVARDLGADDQRLRPAVAPPVPGEVEQPGRRVRVERVQVAPGPERLVRAA